MSAAISLIVGVCLMGTAATDAGASGLTAEAINSATLDGALPDGQSAAAAKLQILLDRAGASPGVIDGYPGENVTKGIRAAETMHGLEVDGVFDPELAAAIDTGAAVIVDYTITSEDVNGRFDPSLPDDYAELAKLEWLGYGDPLEMLAERFHMDVDFLKALNPGADFGSAGTTIMVADPGAAASKAVARVEADKGLRQVRGYSADGALVAAYPATIGSSANPSPSGTHEVTAIAIEPTYSYRPDENFQQGDNTEQLTLPPGPNGPVGIVWIDLSEPTYGLHGTAEPAAIDKTQSHGCVRLTNWDARELADLLQPGTPVAFID